MYVCMYVCIYIYIYICVHIYARCIFHEGQVKAGWEGDTYSMFQDSSKGGAVETV